MDYIGVQINEYKVKDKLGQGGFGAVYKLEDQNGKMLIFFIMCLYLKSCYI